MKLALIGMLFATSAFAYSSKGDVIRLAQSYEKSQCAYEKGGTLTVDRVEYSSRTLPRYFVTYRSPSIFTKSCWSESTEMTQEQLREYYFDANPVAKADYQERLKAQKEEEEKRWNEKSARKIEVGVGDRISILNEAPADYYSRTAGIKVAGANGEQDCSIKGGDLFITKVSPEYVEAVVTKNNYTSWGPGGCFQDGAIRLTREQLNRWYSRTILARQVKLEGKCYEQKQDRTVEMCEEQFKGHQARFDKLRKYCPEWNKLYQWENLDNTPVDKIAADYPGISRAAYQAGINMNDLKFCPGGVPDAGKLRAACLKPMQVKCPGAKVDEEEARRMDNFLHPEKEEKFIRGIMEQQEKNWVPPSEPASQGATLE